MTGMGCLGYDYDVITSSCTLYYGVDGSKLNRGRVLMGMPMEKTCTKQHFGGKLCSEIGVFVTVFF
jgi:hypothetical protein